MRDDVVRTAACAGLAVACAGGFALVAAGSARRRTAHVDRLVARKVSVRLRSRVGRVAEAIAPAGTTYGLVPVALMAAGWAASGAVARPGRGAAPTVRSRFVGAGVIAGVMAATAALEPVLDRVLPQPPMPRARSGERKAVFPSGHALKSTALGMTAGHVLVQQGKVGRGVAATVACALPLVNGGAKLLLGKHWLSDVVAGVLGGVAVGALGCGVYEAVV